MARQPDQSLHALVGLVDFLFVSGLGAIVLAYAPRSEVASLTGQSWLEWLDRGLEERPFSAGSGNCIESLPYRDRDKVADEVDVEGLLDAVRLRLRTPLPGGAG